MYNKNNVSSGLMWNVALNTNCHFDKLVMYALVFLQCTRLAISLNALNMFLTKWNSNGCEKVFKYKTKNTENSMHITKNNFLSIHEMQPTHVFFIMQFNKTFPWKKFKFWKLTEHSFIITAFIILINILQKSKVHSTWLGD